MLHFPLVLIAQYGSCREDADGKLEDWDADGELEDRDAGGELEDRDADGELEGRDADESPAARADSSGDASAGNTTPQHRRFRKPRSVGGLSLPPH